MNVCVCVCKEEKEEEFHGRVGVWGKGVQKEVPNPSFRELGWRETGWEREEIERERETET